MGEDEFWTLVASLEGRVEEPLFDRLTDYLAGRAVEDIVAFADALDTTVRALDLFAFFVQPVWDTEDDLASEPPPLDRAGFLDARAAVVCAGKDVYDRVLADPGLFSGVWDFAAEMLLYVPVEAYEASTRRPWPYLVPGADAEDTEHTLVDDELTHAVEDAYEEQPDLGRRPDLRDGLDLAARPDLDGPTDELPVLVLPGSGADVRRAGPGPERDRAATAPEADREQDPAGFAEPTGSLSGPFEPVVMPDADVPDADVPVGAASGALPDAAGRADGWLVEVMGAYGAEPVEGFLADPSPHFALADGAVTQPWPERVEAEVFPAVSIRLSRLLRAHGGLAGLPVRRLGVVLLLDTYWDLDLLLRPHSGAVRVSGPDLVALSPAEHDEVLLGIAAHVLVEVLSDYRVEHAALPELWAWRDAAAGRVPFKRRRRA